MKIEHLIASLGEARAGGALSTRAASQAAGQTIGKNMAQGLPAADTNAAITQAKTLNPTSPAAQQLSVQDRLQQFKANKAAATTTPATTPPTATTAPANFGKGVAMPTNPVTVPGAGTSAVPPATTTPAATTPATTTPPATDPATTGPTGPETAPPEAGATGPDTGATGPAGKKKSWWDWANSEKSGDAISKFGRGMADAGSAIGTGVANTARAGANAVQGVGDLAAATAGGIGQTIGAAAGGLGAGYHTARQRKSFGSAGADPVRIGDPSQPDPYYNQGGAGGGVPGHGASYGGGAAGGAGGKAAGDAEVAKLKSDIAAITGRLNKAGIAEKKR